MTVIRVEVISDIVCVWCYIGKRTLDRAIALYRKTYPGGKHDTFEIVWRPYYLNYSDRSEEKSAARERKLADWSDAKIAAATNRVEEVGRSVGIHFRHGGRIGPTRDAHRLIHRMQADKKPAEVQDAVIEKLFEAFHEREQDISDKDVLIELAAEAGLDRSEVEGWMHSTSDIETVDDDARRNRQHVTTGVPTFLISGTHRVDGAQDLHEFFEAFIKVKEQDASPSPGPEDHTHVHGPAEMSSHVG